MIPNATQQRAAELLKIYSEAEEELLRIIARRVTPPGADAPPSWAERKLAEVREIREELEEAIARLERQSADVRGKLMLQAHQEGADGLYRELGIQSVNATATQTAVTLIDDMDLRFSELHRRILRDAEDIYRAVLSRSLQQISVGVDTMRQSIQRALAQFADRGITAFTDRAGRRWGIAEYAEMATRTGLKNARIAGWTQEALANGENLVIISDHADECPLCAPWERKVLSLTSDTSHPDCDGMLIDARAAGLFHPNCEHSMTVYMPGLTIRAPGKSTTREQDAAGYAARQAQRHAERQVRKWKRRQAAAITPEDERYAQAYVQRWQRRVREIAEGAKLPRKYDREGGRVLLSEGAKKLKPFKIDENGMIIREGAKK